MRIKVRSLWFGWAFSNGPRVKELVSKVMGLLGVERCWEALRSLGGGVYPWSRDLGNPDRLMK